MKSIESFAKFQAIKNHQTCVIVAKTYPCKVCSSIAIQLEQIMASYPQIPVYGLYLEDVPLFQGQHLVFTVPTIMIFHEAKEILRESRFIDFGKIVRLMEILKSEPMLP